MKENVINRENLTRFSLLLFYVTKLFTNNKRIKFELYGGRVRGGGGKKEMQERYQNKLKHCTSVAVGTVLCPTPPWLI